MRCDLSSGNRFWRTNWRMSGAGITSFDGWSGWPALVSGGIPWCGGLKETCVLLKKCAVTPWFYRV